jgi:hypothetical protein
MLFFCSFPHMDRIHILLDLCLGISLFLLTYSINGIVLLIPNSTYSFWVYWRIINFCIFILHATNIITFEFQEIFVNLFRFSMSSVNKDSFFYSFPISISYLVFYAMILTKNSNLILKISSDKRYLYLIPNLSEWKPFLLFTIKYHITYAFVGISYPVEKFHLYSHFTESFCLFVCLFG